MNSSTETTSLYAYDPSHVLPVVFAALVGMSLVGHIWQNIRYHYWRVTFFMVWAGAIFTAGWIVRSVSSYQPANLSVFIAQTVLILGGSPVYSAAEYNILGRLMHYLPMHAPMNPSRVMYFFIYLGALVEALTGAGGGQMGAAGGDIALLQSGSKLVFVAALLQAAIECLFMAMVGLMHYRCVRSKMLTPNVRSVCIMLYGTSTLVLIRCIFRAIENYNIYNVFSTEKPCEGVCRSILGQEWYLYLFEAAPMVLYTFWLNVMHPGRFLPSQRNRYLDLNKEERIGPGWTDRRNKATTFIDLFDIKGLLKKQQDHEKFWHQPNNWPLPVNGSFAQKTATNVTQSK